METHKVWKFGNDVDTDQIIPSQYLLLPTVEEMVEYTMAPLDKDFASKVKRGDIIVAGDNFGSGSSREQAPRVLKELGIYTIVAKSFARIFFRNAINIGLPVLVCEEIYDNVQDQEIITLDASSGRLINSRGVEYRTTKLPDHINDILKYNGLIGYLNQKSGGN